MGVTVIISTFFGATVGGPGGETRGRMQKGVRGKGFPGGESGARPGNMGGGRATSQWRRWRGTGGPYAPGARPQPLEVRNDWGGEKGLGGKRDSGPGGDPFPQVNRGGPQAAPSPVGRGNFPLPLKKDKLFSPNRGETKGPPRPREKETGPRHLFQKTRTTTSIPGGKADQGHSAPQP